MLDVRIDVVGTGLELVGLGAGPGSLELLLLGGQLLSPGAGGPLIGLRGTAVGLQTGALGQVTVLARLVSASLQSLLVALPGDERSDSNDSTVRSTSSGWISSKMLRSSQNPRG